MSLICSGGFVKHQIPWPQQFFKTYNFAKLTKNVSRNKHEINSLYTHRSKNSLVLCVFLSSQIRQMYNPFTQYLFRLLASNSFPKELHFFSRHCLISWPVYAYLRRFFTAPTLHICIYLSWNFIMGADEWSLLTRKVFAFSNWTRTGVDYNSIS